MNSKTNPRNLAFVMLLIGIGSPYSAIAGEIYGRVGIDGKVYANAAVTIDCPGYSDSRTTGANGAYRSPGPNGEQQCAIAVQGASNTVPVITSQGRTRVNLEVKGGRLYRR